MVELHPQAQALIQAARAANAINWHEGTVEEARAWFLANRGAGQDEPPPVGQVIDRTFEASDRYIPVRIYRPRGTDGTPLPVYVHFHGGGWVVGDLDSHDGLCRNLCAQSGALVVSVDYRLAPEHKFPAALDDALDAIRWIADHGDDLGADVERMAVGGDSAGATLVATACRRMRDESGPEIRFQLLIYPVTDMTMSHPSMIEHGDDYNLTRGHMQWFVDLYLASPEVATHPDASPLFADDLTELPSALIVTAGFDPLRDEGKAYADALQAAGVAVDYVCYEGMIHGFLNMAGVLDDGKHGITRAAEAIKRALT